MIFACQGLSLLQFRVVCVRATAGLVCSLLASVQPPVHFERGQGVACTASPGNVFFLYQTSSNTALSKVRSAGKCLGRGLSPKSAHLLGEQSQYIYIRDYSRMIIRNVYVLCLTFNL